MVATRLSAGALPIDRPRDLMRHHCLNYRKVSAGTLYASEFERDGQGPTCGCRARPR